MADTKYYFFVGTVAELIKVFPIMKEMNSRGVPFKIIASGQNDIVNSTLLKLADVKKVDFVLHEGPIKQSGFSMLKWFWRTWRRSYRLLKSELTGVDGYMLVHGDTISTVMGALIARHFKLKVAHVEAGLRSYNYLNPFPEEIDRVIVSRLTSVSFCPNDWSVNNLKKLRTKTVNTQQNTLVDALDIALKQPEESDIIGPLLKKDYFIFVMHRQENLFNDGLVHKMLDLLEEVAKTKECVFVMHELTRVTLEKKGLLERVKSNPNINVVPRLTYIDFMKLLNGCRFIITDGGSNQEESYYFGKPCAIMRHKTERIEGLNQNVIITKNDIGVITDFVKNYQQYERPRIKPEVRPSQIIVDYFTKA